MSKADEVRKAMVAAMKAKDKERKEKHEKNKIKWISSFFDSIIIPYR